MSRRAVFLLVFGSVLFRLYPADSAAPELPLEPLFAWEFLWTGSWENTFKPGDASFNAAALFHGGTLLNRGEVRLGIPRLHLNFRFQGLDRRKLPEGGADPFYPGIGVYFNGFGLFGGSRLFHGVVEEYGLPARIKNLWSKAPPYTEYRRPSLGELKTDSSSGVPETYLYLGFPHEGPLTGFAFFQIDNEFSPAFGGGAEFSQDRMMSIRVEGFYTQKKLKPRPAQAWFSGNPALPARDFRLFAAAAFFETPVFGLAADFAFSETFAFGRDLYGNAGFWIGARPWKFSFVVDAAGNRFCGRDGSAEGGGLRFAFRLERSWTRAGLLRFNGILRSSGNNGLNRFSFSANFKPSVPRETPVFRFSRASLSLTRNALVPGKTRDNLEAVLGFSLCSLRIAVSAGLNAKTVLDDSPNPLLGLPFFGYFESSRIALEGAWGYQSFSLNAVSGYTIRFEKNGLWDFSLTGAVSWYGLGRLSLKIAVSVFPVQWDYSISWRLGRFSF